MKNIPTLFLLALSGGAAYYFLKGKKEAFENLIIKPIDIAIDTEKSKQTFWTKIFYDIKLKITNPSGFKINVNEIDLEFLVNKKFVANLKKNTLISIEPKITEIITLNSSISSVNAITTIMDILADSENVQLAIQGSIKTDLGTINIAYTKNV